MSGNAAVANVVQAPRVWGLPLVGNVPEIAWRGSLEFFTQKWQRLGDTFRVHMGGREMTVVAHPDGVERILGTNRENYIKGRTYDSVRPLVGEGLLTLEGAAWRARRRLAQPSFHRESIRGFVETMVKSTHTLLERLQSRIPEGGVIDAYPEMLRLTLDIVCETLFGQRIESDNADASAHAFGEALELVSDRGNGVLHLPLSIPTPANRRFKRAMETLDKTVHSIIRAARDAKARGTAQSTTLLSMLLDARDADTGEGLTDQELRNEVITLFLAGHETTALLLTWGFTLLGPHPDVVTRMRREVHDVLGDRDPTADDVPKLVYIRQVVDEILRLRSPVWALARDVVAEDSLCGFRVRPGDTVMPMPYLTHRHPLFWERPDSFDPSRFEPERVRARNHWAYYPFSLGPRMCIGNTFSLTEAQVIFAMLLQRADFNMASFLPVSLDPRVTLRPGGPVNVRIRWRSSRVAL